MDVERHAFVRQLQGLSTEFNLLGHDFAAAQGLHTTDVQALLCVMNAALDQPGTPVNPGWLRQELGITSGAVSAVLDRLERAGHLRRTRDGSDRRQVQIHYNPGAGALAAAWFRPVGESTDAVRAEFSADELRTVSRFLERMTESLNELRQGRRSGR
ncbi:MarR family winged helix-turn-helix transcriptional regulator [Streptacidiphilus sp. PAMC 29251]